MMTTFSPLSSSWAVKSRPATSGMPRVAKKPGEIVRKRARGSSSPFSFFSPSTVKAKPGPKPPASRHGTVLPLETRSTPGTCATRRCTSR